MDLQIAKSLDRAGMLRNKEAVDSILDQQKNPERYTTNAPNTASKAAFSTQNWSGAGRDGLKRGKDTFYYKLDDTKDTSTDKPKPALDLNPTPEATQEAYSEAETTIEPSAEPTAERASAKERAQKFKGSMNGYEGSDFTAV